MIAVSKVVLSGDASAIFGLAELGRLLGELRFPIFVTMDVDDIFVKVFGSILVSPSSLVNQHLTASSWVGALSSYMCFDSGRDLLVERNFYQVVSSDACSSNLVPLLANSSNNAQKLFHACVSQIGSRLMRDQVISAAEVQQQQLTSPTSGTPAALDEHGVAAVTNEDIHQLVSVIAAGLKKEIVKSRKEILAAIVDEIGVLKSEAEKDDVTVKTDTSSECGDTFVSGF